MMAAVYFYLPKMTGHMYNEKLGKLHFWLTFISFNTTFFPMMLVGLSGMPRHLVDYAEKYAGWNFVSSVSAIVLGLSQLIFLYNVIQTARGKGEKVGDKPWEGAEGLY